MTQPVPPYDPRQFGKTRCAAEFVAEMEAAAKDCKHEWRTLNWKTTQGYIVPVEDQCLHCGKYRDEVEPVDA